MIHQWQRNYSALIFQEKRYIKKPNYELFNYNKEQDTTECQVRSVRQTTDVQKSGSEIQEESIILHPS